MSLFQTRRQAEPVALHFVAFLRRVWADYRNRRAARASFDRILDRSDDHLLEDVGLDRETAHRLIGNTLHQPHRAFDRWQL